VTRRAAETLEPFRRYAREQIAPLLGAAFSQAIWNAGVVVITPNEPKHLVLLVTLHKGGMATEHQYDDRFVAPDLFQWKSQNRTRQRDKNAKLMQDHGTRGVQVHLFVRGDKRRGGVGAAPFVYCGTVRFERWEGEAPITVWWRLAEPVPERLRDELLG
jgi:hypothetical protein